MAFYIHHFLNIIVCTYIFFLLHLFPDFSCTSFGRCSSVTHILKEYPGRDVSRTQILDPSVETKMTFCKFQSFHIVKFSISRDILKTTRTTGKNLRKKKWFILCFWVVVGYAFTTLTCSIQFDTIAGTKMFAKNCLYLVD